MALSELQLERQQLQGVFAMIKMLQFLKIWYLDPVAKDLGCNHQKVQAHFWLFFRKNPL